MNSNREHLDYINVAKDGRECTATLYVNACMVHSVKVLSDKEDYDPMGSAVARLFHEFEQKLGRNIRRSDRKSEPSRPAVSEEKSAGRS